MSAEPLSLEDQCLLQVIYHLEQYPSKQLASLPLHLRRRLFLNLPAADVCQLEDTPVASGIDIDQQVWSELLSTIGHPNHWKRPFSSSMKQDFLDDVFQTFLQGKLDEASCLLFSLRGDLHGHDWERLQHSFPPAPEGLYTFPVPFRHIKCLTRESVILQVLSFLAHMCSCCPENIWIDCEQFVGSDLWKRRGLFLCNLLSDLFSRTKLLYFSLDGSDSEAYGVPQFVFELVFSRPQVALSSLKFDGEPGDLFHALKNASLFFSAPSCVQDQVVLQSFSSSVSLPTIPYSGLTSITILGNHFCEDEPEGRPELYDALESIVQNQHSLEHIQLSGDCDSPCPLRVLTTLASLFRRPQFKLLKFQYGDIDWDSLSVLIPPFLAAPISQGHTQELCFDGVSLLIPNDPVWSDINVDSCSKVPGKHLHFSDVLVWYTDDLAPFFKWLLYYRCPELLSSFDFTYADDTNMSTQRANISGLSEIMSLFANNRYTALLENVTISGFPLSLEPSPVAPFITLFRAPCLRQLSLTKCNIGKDGLLPALTLGLTKQVSVGLLEGLDLDYNDLGSVNDEDFQGFCDAVCSLPQLGKLSLSLKWNDLKHHHFEILHCACKPKTRTGRLRMKTLSVVGSEYDSLLLKEIALTGDFLEK